MNPAPGAGRGRRLALAIAGLGFAAALRGQTVLVEPYVQPGNGSALGPADVKVIAWMTDAAPGKFTVAFGAAGQPERSVTPRRTALHLSPTQQYLTYAAELTDLPLNAEVAYRVELDGRPVGTGTFATRKTPEQDLRFVVVGDIGAGTPSQRAIAYHMARARPEFAVICGDVVYPRGLVSDYLKNFWPVYTNAPRADAADGAPLMRSVPFYVALGNHDVGVGTDLAKYPDGGSAFYFFYPPRNGPAAGTWLTPMHGAPDQLARFRGATENAGYPHLGLYSFDNGPAHFLVLDSDTYVPVTDPAMRAWIQQDLAASHQRWKFVFFHHPPFQSADKHWKEQRTRLLVPLFEHGGVDVVFAGHVHNYQRSKPLRFTPASAAAGTGPVRGTFAIDQAFDGHSNTTPQGILYIVTGGGGAGLYSMGPDKAPHSSMPDPDAPAGFTATYSDDRRSFTVIDLGPNRLALQQLDEHGTEIDRLTVTKPGR